VALATIASACAPLTSPEDGPPDFSGVVLGVEPPSGAWRLNLRIERSSGDTAIVWIGGSTRLFAAGPDGTVQGMEPDELEVGASVDVWTTGVERRSLPPQYDATQVVVGAAANDVVATTATVRFVDLEGGCWILETPSGPYEPMGLPDAFRIDGLAVYAVLRRAPDAASICQMAPLVTLDSIRAL
jgi:hypothetical protein